MFTKAFWRDTTERAVKTAAQSLGGALAGYTIGQDWKAALVGAAVTTASSLSPPWRRPRSAPRGPRPWWPSQADDIGGPSEPPRRAPVHRDPGHLHHHRRHGGGPRRGLLHAGGVPRSSVASRPALLGGLHRTARAGLAHGVPRDGDLPHSGNHSPPVRRPGPHPGRVRLDVLRERAPHRRGVLGATHVGGHRSDCGGGRRNPLRPHASPP